MDENEKKLSYEEFNQRFSAGQSISLSEMSKDAWEKRGIYYDGYRKGENKGLITGLILGSATAIIMMSIIGSIFNLLAGAIVSISEIVVIIIIWEKF